MQPLPIAQSVQQSLAFFSLFEKGVTREELYRNLWRGGVADKKSMDTALDQLVESEGATYDRGYYGLGGYAAKRIERIPLLEKKLRIARRGARILRFVPFVRAVFICNNLAFETVSAESDVDVFIVTAPKRIWIARLFSTLSLRLFRLARTRTVDTDRICLSFYATESSLDFSSLPITDPDVYLAYWVHALVPLYDPHNLYQKIQKQNTWSHRYLKPGKQYRLSNRFRVEDSVVSKGWTTCVEAMWKTQIGDLIENQAREAQKTKMKFRWGSVRDEPDTRVIVSDEMLKFHENDRRAIYKETWESRIV